jgi:hypothetical protein
VQQGEVDEEEGDGEAGVGLGRAAGEATELLDGVGDGGDERHSGLAMKTDVDPRQLPPTVSVTSSRQCAARLRLKLRGLGLDRCEINHVLDVALGVALALGRPGLDVAGWLTAARGG